PAACLYGTKSGVQGLPGHQLPGIALHHAAGCAFGPPGRDAHVAAVLDGSERDGVGRYAGADHPELTDWRLGTGSYFGENALMFQMSHALNDLQGRLASDALGFLPELILCGAIVFLLLLRLFSSLNRWHLGWLALLFTLVALAA